MQVRLTPEVAEQVAALAEQERRSLSQMATLLVEEALSVRTLPSVAADDVTQLTIEAALVGRGTSVTALDTQSTDPVPQVPRPTSAASGPHEDEIVDPL